MKPMWEIGFNILALGFVLILVYEMMHEGEEKGPIMYHLQDVGTVVCEKSIFTDCGLNLDNCFVFINDPRTSFKCQKNYRRITPVE